MSPPRLPLGQAADLIPLPLHLGEGASSLSPSLPVSDREGFLQAALILICFFEGDPHKQGRKTSGLLYTRILGPGLGDKMSAALSLSSCHVLWPKPPSCAPGSLCEAFGCFCHMDLVLQRDGSCTAPLPSLLLRCTISRWLWQNAEHPALLSPTRAKEGGREGFTTRSEC